MNKLEQQVWAAAYAAHFVEQFRSTYETLEPHGNRGTAGSYFDRTVELSSAEASITIADLAVQRLRGWRRDESPDAGIAVEDRSDGS